MRFGLRSRDRHLQVDRWRQHLVRSPSAKAEFSGKGVGEILIVPGSPDTMYVGIHHGAAGHELRLLLRRDASGAGRGQVGLYKTTDGGDTWSFIHNGSTNVADCLGTIPEFNNTPTCSPRGVRDIAFDPNDANTIYASSYARGIWRSTDAGGTWTQIKPSLNAAVIQTRAAIAVTELPSGATRMYIHEGNAGQNYSRLFRSDSVATGGLSSPTSPAPMWRIPAGERGASAIRSAGTTSSSTRRRATPTWCMSAAITRMASQLPISAASCSRSMPASAQPT